MLAPTPLFFFPIPQIKLLGLTTQAILPVWLPMTTSFVTGQKLWIIKSCIHNLVSMSIQKTVHAVSL